MTTTVPPVLAELTEILAYADFATGASASVREALGLGSLHVCSTRALAIREDPSHFFNRAGGFGADGPITVDDLVQVCAFYRKQGVSQGSLMIAPPLLPPDWAGTAATAAAVRTRRHHRPGHGHLADRSGRLPTERARAHRHPQRRDPRHQRGWLPRDEGRHPQGQHRDRARRCGAVRRRPRRGGLGLHQDRRQGPGCRGLDQATLNALAAAHTRGKLVVAHATASGAYTMAQEAGADVITHVPLDRALDDEAMNRMAADGRIAVPTPSMMEAMSERMDGTRSGHGQARAGVAALHRAGVPILAGTDADSTLAFVPHGTSLHHELELLVDAGLITVDALRAATSLPARHFGLTDRGAVKPGLRADLVLVDGDPIADIRATRQIRRIWCGGTEHTPAGDYGLSDFPAGLLAWLRERWNAWSDNGGDVESVFTKDDLLTHATIYRVNNSTATSMRYYANANRYPWFPAHDRTPVVQAPVRLTFVTYENPPGIHTANQRPGVQDRPAGRLVQPRQLHAHDQGDHFIPWEHPGAWVSDLRRTFHGRRP